MPLKLLKQQFVKACAAGVVGAGLVLPGAAETAGADSAPDPVALSGGAQAAFCAGAPEISQDEQGRRWITVETATRDAVRLSFQLHVAYELAGSQDLAPDPDCVGLDRHVLGLARVVYGAELLALDYADLPAEGAQLPRRAAQQLEARLREIAGPVVNITGFGVRNASAPGLDPDQAAALLSGRLAPPVPAAAPQPGTGYSYDGAKLAYMVVPDFSAGPAAYTLFGPDRAAMAEALREAADEPLRRALAQRPADCLNGDHDFIVAETYSAAAQAAGQDLPALYLLALQVDVQIVAPPDLAARLDLDSGAAPLCLSRALKL